MEVLFEIPQSDFLWYGKINRNTGEMYYCHKTYIKEDKLVLRNLDWEKQNMNNKKYDKKLDDRFNVTAKNECEEIFKQLIPQIERKIHPEMYKDYDIVLSIRGEDIPIEVEVKNIWIHFCTFMIYDEKKETVQIPYRKASSKSKIYVMFNSWKNTAIMARTEDVLKEEYVKFVEATHPEGEISISQSEKSATEPFFAPPLNLFTMFRKTGQEWKMVGNAHEVTFGEEEDSPENTDFLNMWKTLKGK